MNRTCLVCERDVPPDDSLTVAPINKGERFKSLPGGLTHDSYIMFADVRLAHIECWQAHRDSLEWALAPWLLTDAADLMREQ